MDSYWLCVCICSFLLSLLFLFAVLFYCSFSLSLSHTHTHSYIFCLNYLWLGILFSFNCELFVKIWIHTDYVCVFAACFPPSVSSVFVCCFVYFLFTEQFFFTYIDIIGLRLSLHLPLSSLHFLCFVICVTSLSLFCRMRFGDVCSV